MQHTPLVIIPGEILDCSIFVQHGLDGGVLQNRVNLCVDQSALLGRARTCLAGPRGRTARRGAGSVGERERLSVVGQAHVYFLWIDASVPK